MSSLVGLIGPPNLSYYSASKHAVEGFFKSLRLELEQFNIKVSMVEPSWFKTNLGYNSVSSIGKNINDYDTFRKQVNAFTQNGIENGETPGAVINTITKIIEAKAPKFKNLVGKKSGMIVFIKSHAPKLFEATMLKNVKRSQ